MSKRSLVVLIALLSLLAGCSGPAATSSTPGAGSSTAPVTTFAAVDQSRSTPVAGSATTREVPNVRSIFLRSRPGSNSPIAGEVQPGDAGKVLGVEASGTWLLVEIEGQTGWLPVELLQYTIAQ